MLFAHAPSSDEEDNDSEDGRATGVGGRGDIRRLRHRRQTRQAVVLVPAVLLDFDSCLPESPATTAQGCLAGARGSAQSSLRGGGSGRGLISKFDFRE